MICSNYRALFGVIVKTGAAAESRGGCLVSIPGDKSNRFSGDGRHGAETLQSKQRPRGTPLCNLLALRPEGEKLFCLPAWPRAVLAIHHGTTGRHRYPESSTALRSRNSHRPDRWKSGQLKHRLPQLRAAISSLFRPPNRLRFQTYRYW